LRTSRPPRCRGCRYQSIGQGLCLFLRAAKSTVGLDLSQHCHAAEADRRRRRELTAPDDNAIDLQQLQEALMLQFRSYAMSVTFAGLAFSALLGTAAVTVSSKPAGAVVYCTYVGYPQGCVARAGVVLRPRPVARAAVRTGTVGSANLNGGVNRVGVRR